MVSLALFVVAIIFSHRVGLYNCYLILFLYTVVLEHYFFEDGLHSNLNAIVDQ